MADASLIHVMNSPRLWGPHFAAPSWRPWKAFATALFGLEMTDSEYETFTACTGRVTPPTAPFTEAALVCGRRSGKTFMLATIACFLAAFKDWQPYLAVGEVATIACICSDRSQARVIIRYCKGLLQSVPELADLIEGPEHSQRISLPRRRVVIEVSTASFQVTRGYSFAAVLADECAFWNTAEDAAISDIEVLRAVRPGLLTLRPAGSMMFLASSPFARRGALWETYKRHWSEDASRVLVWQASSLQMNSSLDADEVLQAKIDDPEGASAEYDAQFRADVSPLLDREIVEGCVIRGRYELPASWQYQYQAFCDPSGGSSDSMTLAIAHGEDRVDGTRIVVIDAVREVKAPFDPSTAVLEFSGLLLDYRLSSVVGDKYAGAWPPTMFSQHNIRYEPAEFSKAELYLSLLPLVNGGRIELPDNPRLVAQLCSLERRVVRGTGREVIDSPPRMHEDMANVVAGVAQLVAGKPDPVTIRKALATPDAQWRGAQLFGGF